MCIYWGEKSTYKWHMQSNPCCSRVSFICLSFSDSFHLALCPQVSFIWSQMTGCFSLLWLYNNTPLCVCVCVCVCVCTLYPCINWQKLAIFISCLLWIMQQWIKRCKYLFVGFVLFCFVCLFRAAPVAYGGSQASDQIGAVAASLCQSHSNAGSKPCLWPIPQLTATQDP